MLDDARVVARREPGGTDATREGEELGEPEAAVAADARIRRLAAGVTADERLDDRAPKLFAQVERHMRQPEAMARLARGDHRTRRAARAFGVGAVRVEPQPKRHPDRAGPGLAGA